MPGKKARPIIFALFIIFITVAPAYAAENLTILYTGGTDARITPVPQ